MSSKRNFLQSLARDLNSSFKSNIAAAGVDPNLSDAGSWRIPTNSVLLNCILGGGVPVGRTAEVYGEPSHGKSTIIQHMMIGFQKAGGISILLDAESSWSRDRAIRMGHDPERHLHLQAGTVESAISTIEFALKNLRMPGKYSELSPDAPIGIFYDSIAATPTEGEKEADIYKDGMADKARKIRRAMRTLFLDLPTYKASLVFTNQTIATMSQKGPKKTTPGGGSVKFAASKRIEVRRISRFANFGNPKAGILSSIENVKDKLDPPFREVVVPIMHYHGIDPTFELINYLVDNSNYVNESAGRIYVRDYPEEGADLNIGFRKAGLKEGIVTPELLQYLTTCVEGTWRENNPGGSK